MPTLNVLILVIIACEGLPTAFACPKECICKWKNGKQSVECAEKDLTFLPNTLDTGTQVLDFSGNNLQVLQKEAFHKIGLVNLQKIYISHCRLHKIDNHAFKGLTNLVELDISQNYLTVIPAANFLYFPALMRLILSENPITTIKSQTFQHLAYLTTLEISNCKVEVVENEAFAGLGHLEWLRLDGNKLTTIQGENILPESLRGVDLQNNEWNCDCQLQDLHTWLRNFNLPHAVEPSCSKPLRMASRAIRSIQEIELACLPEITPTYLYLEINEGKNITLECKVTAIPEAKISWWFQGHILQNDSVIAPGFRLIYFVEEGSIDKKSELYIYNTNSEDNGTFSCLAENPAGKSMSNYTIKIIVQEEPIVIVVTFPYKYSVVLISAGLIIGILVLTIIIVAIVGCKADSKRRKKKESGKDVAMQHQNGSTKNCSPAITVSTLPPKQNGSLIINTQAHHMVHYPMNVPREFIINVADGNTFSPNSLRNYVEKNPDLIHDTESVDKKREMECEGFAGFEASNPMADTYDENLLSLPPNMPRQVKWKDQQNCHKGIATLPRGTTKNNMYQHSADVHLNPGCFLDTEGYPPDYGLPKITCRPGLMTSMAAPATTYYQTLPHNRNKMRRLPQQYAKDTEFNSIPCPDYEQFNPADTRYTVEGYPFARNRPQVTFAENGTVSYQDPSFVPSPPEGYKSETVEPCCAGMVGGACSAAWPTTAAQCAAAAASLQVRPSLISEVGVNATCYHIQTRCVNTQTSEADARPACDGEASCSKVSTMTAALTAQVASVKTEPETCTESPDEGYVGDGGIDATDI